jgi:hypothetical protein
MNTEIALNALIYLGSYLKSLTEEEALELGEMANRCNGWFTPQQVKFTLEEWSNALSENSLTNWLNNYQITEPASPQKVGIIMAGNIPLVGLHDLVCVLLTGHIAHCKLSSQDPFLPKHLIDKLIELEPQMAGQINVVDKLNEADAVIATGSNNSARYFQYYFGKKPHIIRSNRSSCAILTGKESAKELERLGLDMLQYYGLGCRSVSKLLVPEGYNLTPFFEAIEPYNTITHNHKWVNNYDYHKSIFLVNKEPHLDNGFLLLKESEQLGGPVSVVFYQEYSSEEELDIWLSENRKNLQCVVGSAPPATVAFGQAQRPRLSDYADGVDTIEFLRKL